MTEIIIRYAEPSAVMDRVVIPREVVGELVRCKDCRHYGSDGGALMVCDVSDMVVDDTDYCSYGERREP